MSSPYLTTTYATDEDLAARATGDFAILCPDWQKQAYGVDGVFASGTPWALTSASVDFAASGVVPGMVATLTQPRSIYRGSGDLLAVDSAAGSTLTLRRVGQLSGVGSAPGPAVGLTGVEFTVLTMGPQIEEASYSLNRAWNIDPAVAYRSPTRLYDLRDLREATVLTVLLRRYIAETRTDRGDFPIKIRAMQAALDEVTSRLSIRWGSNGDDPPAGSLFTMRIVR